MARTTGMPDNLIRSTMPPEPSGDPVDDQADAELNGEGRGGLPARKPKARGRRIAAGEKATGRKFQVRDRNFEKLQLHAIKKKTSVSAIIDELISRHIPEHRIETAD
jgi:hypothetical protein